MTVILAEGCWARMSAAALSPKDVLRTAMITSAASSNMAGWHRQQKTVTHVFHGTMSQLNQPPTCAQRRNCVQQQAGGANTEA
jgi:hypothetical protein